MTEPFRIWVVGGADDWRSGALHGPMRLVADRFPGRPLILIHTQPGAAMHSIAKCYAEFHPAVSFQNSHFGVKPHLCLAFAGAEQQIERARANGLRIYEVKE